MNIYAKKGDKVIFTHFSNGYKGNQETAQKHLIVGEIYTIERTSVGGGYTSVYLDGFPAIAFNSAMFDDEPESRTKRGIEKGIPRPENPYCEANYPHNCALMLAEENGIDMNSRKISISVSDKLCPRCEKHQVS